MSSVYMSGRGGRGGEEPSVLDRVALILLSRESAHGIQHNKTKHQSVSVVATVGVIDDSQRGKDG